MKPQTANSAVPSTRCSHRTAAGRRCRQLATDAHSGLCPHHLAEQKQIEAADHYDHLTTNFHCFQTAQGINHSLGNLYELLAKNRISPRRAAVLSYISSLLLRTLPQIDADNAAGIKFRPDSITVADPNPAPDTPANPRTDPDHPSSLSTWDPSLPEPDPKKKPS